jgi:DNA-binding NarL/FixJ family response regulator
MIRVLIYDDNDSRCRHLEALLNLSEQLECVGSFKTAEHVEEEVQLFLPDVVLMDINMPMVNGVEATKRIKFCRPETKIIIQTVFDNDENIFNSLKAGAEGYLLKTASPEKIIRSIEEVQQGGAVMTPSIAIKVMRFFNAAALPVSPQFDLTIREKEVLFLMAEGMSYKMIAAKLGISYFTVNTFTKKIYEKLHVNSMGEAVAIAHKNKLI